jgi:hypothetical protein
LPDPSFPLYPRTNYYLDAGRLRLIENFLTPDKNYFHRVVKRYQLMITLCPRLKVRVYKAFGYPKELKEFLSMVKRLLSGILALFFFQSSFLVLPSEADGLRTSPNRLLQNGQIAGTVLDLQDAGVLAARVGIFGC